MAMNPINATITTTGTYVYGVDWRDAPNGFAYQVVFNAGASGSVTVDTTLDNVNDPSVTPVWTTGTTVTSTTSGSIATPVQFVQLSVNTLSGGTLGFKILQGAPDNAGSTGGGGGGGGAVTIADGADVAEGSTTDAASAVGGTGTVSAKLRRISAQLAGQASLVTGQYKVTASATVISSSVALANGVVIKAKSTNAGTVFLGGSGVTTTYDGTGNGYALGPGEAASFPVNNLNLIYAIGTANDVISWEGN